ncbi:GNAT family N-acetyltransferase [Clostridium akagii]|uniref:GNAT family N-acetyltransferase n=1 Tax=Clostridium akagii TaxID=91623 RepID=UPI00047DA6D3|nr:N-acetyltransferase [Clostridium akagii]
MIRNMKFEDIEKIKEIDKLSFKADKKRTTQGIEGYIEASNNSSLVYEIDNTVVGYNFIHLCGSFAWFGPFGVHPKYQGKGIGKALINHTIKILKENYKVSTIGLNTMPESQYNVGFYMGLGFTPLRLSLNLKKQLNFDDLLPLPNDYNVDEVDISNEHDYLTLKDNLKRMCNEIFHYFDLNSELHLIKYEGFGTIFTVKAYGKVHSIVICHTKAVRDTNTKNLQIKLAIIDNTVNYKVAVDSIVSACTKYAKNINYDSISIDCNTYNAEICNFLISKHNFKIQKTQIMMILGNDNPFKSSKAILLTRLAG